MYNKLSKGEMSLELIVKFVILGVAALLVVSMLIRTLDNDPVDGQGIERVAIQNECRDICNRWTSGQDMDDAIEYCTKKFVSDIEGDGSFRGVTGSGENRYCEDGIYCFNEINCETDRGDRLDAERCTDILCEHYSQGDALEDVDNAGAGYLVYRQYEPGVDEEERGLGTCGLQELEIDGIPVNTWWHQHVLAGQDWDGVHSEYDAVDNAQEAEEGSQEYLQEICD